MAHDEKNRLRVAVKGMGSISWIMAHCMENPTIQLYGCFALYNCLFRNEMAHYQATRKRKGADSNYGDGNDDDNSNGDAANEEPMEMIVLIQKILHRYDGQSDEYDEDLVSAANKLLKALEPNGWRSMMVH
eukprot:CAMPEP_0194366212 /NCGR_PEP_ID=MMETSP0174-20130528/14239_1 /TAXON_ID=216777 /ORGANISM="Proboscia alata, Strain PI-D3" /LENGTH=130 /DNA_ID=CAMNT_0039141275 /DNA_START=842 /DNA_END=1234 /DNA_ORIENTATION=-